MKKPIRYLSLLLFLLPLAVSAQNVYRFNDENGAPVFTDKPPPPDTQAEEIQLPEPGQPADAEERLNRINETATILRDDRKAREETRANQRREAREDRLAREAAEAAKQPIVVERGGYYGGRYPVYPGYRPGWRPGYPGYRPHPPKYRPENPIYRPPKPYPEPQPSGGRLRGVGPGGTGW